MNSTNCRFQFIRDLFFATAIYVALLSIAGCDEKHAPASNQQAPLVRVQLPVVKPVTDYEYFTGRSEAPESLDLRSKVNGYLVRWNFDQKSDQPPLKEFNFVPGQEVKRDQVLFKIDPRPYQAVYDQAMAQIELAKAQLKLAKADYARALNVAKTPGAISQQDVDKYLAAQGKAEAEVAAQEANAESARLNLAYTDVKTDITGIVSRNLLSVGNLVEANTLLTTVVSEDPMYAYFNIDEATLLHLGKLMREGKLKAVREAKPGEYGKYPVDLALSGSDAQYLYTAYVDFVNNQIDPTTGTLQVRGVISNPKPPQGPRIFAPGMFLQIRLPIGDPHDALLVQQAAIGTDQSDRYVFIVNDKNIVEYRPVKTGQEQPGGLQEVIPQKIVLEQGGGYRLAKQGEQGVDSITANAQIVVGGLQRVRPGMQVQPKVETTGTN